MYYAKHTTSKVSVGDVLPNEIWLAKLHILSLVTHFPVQHFLVCWVFQLTFTVSKLK